MIEIRADHAALRAAAALTASLMLMNAGSTPAVLRLYAQSFGVNEEPSTPPLVDFVLVKPAGTITAGVLTLTLPGDILIVNSGLVLRGRITNGAGAHCGDCSVSGIDDEDFDDAAVIILPTRQLYAGGVTRLLAGTLR